MDKTCLNCRSDLFDICGLTGKKNKEKKACKEWEAPQGFNIRIRPKALEEYIKALNKS